jgi:hypothetical protein
MARLGGAEIVLRRALVGEWDRFGEDWWKWLAMWGLELRSFMAICVLLQRMGICGLGVACDANWMSLQLERR